MSHDYKGTIFLEVLYHVKFLGCLKLSNRQVQITVRQEISENYRHVILIQTLESAVFHCPLSVAYLFYDTNADGTLVIFNDPEYNESFKSFVM